MQIDERRQGQPPPQRRAPGKRELGRERAQELTPLLENLSQEPASGFGNRAEDRELAVAQGLEVGTLAVVRACGGHERDPREHDRGPHEADGALRPGPSRPSGRRAGRRSAVVSPTNASPSRRLTAVTDWECPRRPTGDRTPDPGRRDDGVGEGEACRPCHRVWLVLAPAYMESISSLYFVSMTRRFTLSVGVSSRPRSTGRS
jgi:hypothetical protein